MATLSPNLTANVYNPNVSYCNSWIQVDNDLNKSLFAQAAYLTNASDIKLSLSGLNIENLEINTDEVESLLRNSNTLLDALTSKKTTTDTINIETKLDALTSVYYATETKQDKTISLLESITSADINVAGFKIPPYDEININYVGSTNNLDTVAYKNNSTVVMTLSFAYIPQPPTTDNATLKTVKKI